MRYIAFDVETPNRYNNRMSAIGVTVIDGGKITDEYYYLVNPETSFDYFNINLTGISEETVAQSPTFPEVWRELEPIMSSGMPVAHNAVFDLTVLKHCLKAYDIEWKPYTRYLCTVKIGRALLPDMSRKLNALCDYYGITLNHHHAGSDSRACAEILLRYQQSGADLSGFIRTYSFREKKNEK